VLDVDGDYLLPFLLGTLITLSVLMANIRAR
jgi:hypothetical protein